MTNGERLVLPEPDPRTLWNDRADVAQRSLDHYFAAPGRQLYDNWHPLGPGDNDVFNYWWLAHAMDARIDAYERTSDPSWLDRAGEIHANILARNDGSLFNDYFDDMLWFGLAILRLADARGDDELRAEAAAIWRHVLENGWNEHEGGGIAWRVPQPYYKNTPANGPFVVLSARLHRHTGDPAQLAWGRRAMEWLERVLVRADGFVHDGINRQQDHVIDEQWRFTYNQGLYIGACVELAGALGDDDYLRRASRTARTALAELTTGGVFADEGGGGDEGLFKGVFYRYARLLVDAADVPDLRDFMLASTERLWRSCARDGTILAGPVWTRAADGKVPLSAQLSAVMATEACAALVSSPVAPA
ncbi:glycoside hydrolase [Nonomuraea deserti]|uniref:Glycoside hydrolase n=1 Tax=Nonomuraea deserti TaxID=1848322 RepID=A0A4V2YA55_9ACTN|nr:glycoside hydrolase family 76 protein [Nonomuraea deserti]TDD02486.1 glycoside hydrolase [Nonomuraea deserti]